MSAIQIPLIFDVSSNGTVFGEDISGDVITNHLKLKVTPTTAQSTAFINAMKNILYSDVSNNSATDSSGVLFYKKIASPHNAIGDAIKNFFFDTTGIIHAGSTNATRFGEHSNGKYGIPIGINQVNASDVDQSGTANAWYTDAFIDSDGTEFHKILLRVAATHLMGHPFSQGFIQENTIKTDLQNCDLSGQINTHLKLDTLSTATVGTAIDPVNGKQVQILQTIYEQLLMHNMSDMSGSDQSGSDTMVGFPRELVFKALNTVTFYVRPRLFLNVDVSGGISSMSTAVGNALGISGSQFSADLSGTKLETFNKIFSTNSDATSPTGYKWLAGRGTAGAFSQWETNLAWDGLVNDQSGGAVAMLDAHVWRIDITLQ
tara:strand:- start:3785 stop:4906 length:1122 start_codon:yes stop_codon:yes gene_type:complete